MFDRITQVSHSQDKGFTLYVFQPTWRHVFLPLGHFLIQPFGSFWIPGVSTVLYHAGQKIVVWADDHAEELVAIPIDRATADKLAYDEDDWDWVDD